MTQRWRASNGKNQRNAITTRANWQNGQSATNCDQSIFQSNDGIGSGKGGIHNNTQVNPASESALQFSHALKGVLDTVDKYQAHASDKITAVELGKSDDLLGATVASQKAQLSFNALMQVRNKMVSNFQDIIKMPI